MRLTHYLIALLAVMASFVCGFFAAEKLPDNVKAGANVADCPDFEHYMRDYQIQLHMDTVWIYDKDRLVGSFTNTTWNSQYDSIFLKDNE
jgi:hypothetical protein